MSHVNMKVCRTNQSRILQLSHFVFSLTWQLVFCLFLEVRAIAPLQSSRCSKDISLCVLIFKPKTNCLLLHKLTFWRLHPKCAEQRRVSEGQFYHLLEHAVVARYKTACKQSNNAHYLLLGSSSAVWRALLCHRIRSALQQTLDFRSR